MGMRSITLTEAVARGEAVAYDGGLPDAEGEAIAGVAFDGGASGDVVTIFTPGEASVFGVADNAMNAGAYLVAQTDGALSGSNAGGDLTGFYVVGRAEEAVTAAGDPVRFTYDSRQA